MAQGLSRRLVSERVGRPYARLLRCAAVALAGWTASACGDGLDPEFRFEPDAAIFAPTDGEAQDTVISTDGWQATPDAGRVKAKGTRYPRVRPSAWATADSTDSADTEEAGSLIGSDAAALDSQDPSPCPTPDSPGGSDPAGPMATPMAACAWETGLTAALAAPKSAPLAITLGRKADTTDGTFVALQKGDWLGLHHGMQGSFHAYVAFQVLLPGSSGSNQKVVFDAWLADACAVIAGGTPPQIWLWPVPGKPGQWGNTENGDPGTVLYFDLPSAEASKFCGKWATLHLRVLNPKTGEYGEASEQVRLFDTMP